QDKTLLSKATSLHTHHHLHTYEKNQIHLVTTKSVSPFCTIAAVKLYILTTNTWKNERTTRLDLLTIK
ncbi:hypothetical protein ACHAXS_004660, partial [Conticribra weissflogii]